MLFLKRSEWPRNSDGTCCLGTITGPQCFPCPRPGEGTDTLCHRGFAGSQPRILPWASFTNEGAATQEG